jgi:hypothetical protein
VTSAALAAASAAASVAARVNPARGQRPHRRVGVGQEPLVDQRGGGRGQAGGERLLDLGDLATDEHDVFAGRDRVVLQDDHRRLLGHGVGDDHAPRDRRQLEQ